jgi:hypothetical protein
MAAEFCSTSRGMTEWSRGDWPVSQFESQPTYMLVAQVYQGIPVPSIQDTCHPRLSDGHFVQYSLTDCG